MEVKNQALSVRLPGFVAELSLAEVGMGSSSNINAILSNNCTADTHNIRSVVEPQQLECDPCKWIVRIRGDGPLGPICTKTCYMRNPLTGQRMRGPVIRCGDNHSCGSCPQGWCDPPGDLTHSCQGHPHSDGTCRRVYYL